jgi:hypothetical protein
MFRHYIAILRERSQCLLIDAQLRSSLYNIVDGRVVSNDVVRGDLRHTTYMDYDPSSLVSCRGTTDHSGRTVIHIHPQYRYCYSSF